MPVRICSRAESIELITDVSRSFNLFFALVVSSIGYEDKKNALNIYNFSAIVIKEIAVQLISKTAIGIQPGTVTYTNS